MGVASGLLVALIASVLSVAFGAIWYGPFFGKEWARLAKIKKTKPAKPMLYGLLRHFITASIITILFTNVEFRSALLTVFILWLGFTAMPGLSEVIWTKKPLKLAMINVAYELASVIIMVVVVTWFSSAQLF